MVVLLHALPCTQASVLLDISCQAWWPDCRSVLQHFQRGMQHPLKACGSCMGTSLWLSGDVDQPPHWIVQVQQAALCSGVQQIEQRLQRLRDLAHAPAVGLDVIVLRLMMQADQAAGAQQAAAGLLWC